jgi:hypothetical protein
MAARVVNHEQCPKCRERGRDSRGDNLGIYSDGGAWCFSCGYFRSPNILKIHEDNGSRVKKIKELPDDYTKAVPPGPLQWLLSFGISFNYWSRIIGWSDRDNRLIFRLGDTNCYIGRYFGDTKGKPKWYHYGDPNGIVEVVGDNGPVVLVEDLISAHQVGNVCTGVPLFGTHVRPEHLYYLRSLDEDRPVVLWQDKDQEQLVHKRAASLSVLLNRDVSVVITDQDPKAIPRQDILKLMSEIPGQGSVVINRS